MKGSKGSVDEGGVRVPFFIRWPGKIAKGRTIHDLAAHIDVLPTLMELADVNVDLPNKLDGRSLLSLISSSKAPKAPAWPERLIFTQGPGTNMTPGSGAGAARSNQYRYVLSRGEEGLYDMINDPGQEKDLKKSKKKIFDELKAAYIEWLKDVSAGWEPNTTIPVGYKEFPATYLQAVEAKLQGKLKFNGRGFAHDWIVNWTNPKDKITWDINVITSGRYKVSLDYVVPESDVGATIKISTGKASISSKITRAFNPELFPAHDRSKRAGELEKPWKKIVLGEMDIDKGNTQVILSADTMTGKQVIEVRRVTLELISSK
jgi:arylsulfatase A